jgi:hypothetical protein
VKPEFLRAATGMFFLLCSCSFKKQPVFAFYSEEGGALYALSKNAAAGILPLSGSGKLEYVFETPLTVGGDLSFELDYRLPGAGNDGRGRIVLELGELSWELPQDLSFLGISGELPALRYAVPLPEGKLETIGLSYIPQSPVRDGAPELEIRAMALEGRWYGFAGGGPDLSFRVTPFVYLRDSALIIDPPERFRGGGKTLHIGTGGGSFMVEGGEDGIRGYFRIEASAAGRTFWFRGSLFPLNPIPWRSRRERASGNSGLFPPGTTSSCPNLSPPIRG